MRLRQTRLKMILGYLLTFAVAIAVFAYDQLFWDQTLIRGLAVLLLIVAVCVLIVGLPQWITMTYALTNHFVQNKDRLHRRLVIVNKIWGSCWFAVFIAGLFTAHGLLIISGIALLICFATTVMLSAPQPTNPIREQQ